MIKKYLNNLAHKKIYKNQYKERLYTTETHYLIYTPEIFNLIGERYSYGYYEKIIGYYIANNIKDMSYIQDIILDIDDKAFLIHRRLTLCLPNKIVIHLHYNHSAIIITHRNMKYTDIFTHNVLDGARGVTRRNIVEIILNINNNGIKI